MQNIWGLLPSDTGPARAPLFCVHAGAGLLEYQDLAHALPDDQPIYVFGLPALQDYPLLPTVERLAVLYVSQLRNIQKCGPYRLCGFSFGGLVAYEMAGLLMDQGEDVNLLALLDTRHPRPLAHSSHTQRAKLMVVYEIERLSRYARNLLRGRIDSVGADVAQFVISRSRRLGWRCARVLFHRLDRPVPDVIRNEALLLRDAWYAYTPRKYSGNLLLIRANIRDLEYRSDLTLGWNYNVQGRINVHCVAGSHLSIMKRPDVLGVARILKPHLDDSAHVS